MCVFLSLRINKAQIKKQFDVSDVADEFFGPVYVQSAFDYRAWPVITTRNPQSVQLFSWGLIPSWVKNEEAAMKIRNGTVNARIETVSEKPAFRVAVRRNRCLVPADGFYEFREVNKTKYPYFITLKKQDAFALAGIFDSWLHPDTGEIVNSFSILTTEANKLMAKIHNRKLRMPVILDRLSSREWLDEATAPENFSRPFPSEQMDAWTVSKLLVSRTEERNVPKACERIEYPEIVMADQLNI